MAGALADRDQLGVRSRVLAQLALVVACADHLALVDEHSADRHVVVGRRALRLAQGEQAPAHDDVPVGAVLVHGGEVIGAGHNERELRADPTAHAEMIAIREGARAVGSWRLLDTVLYVTLEPCAMCAGAIVLARIPRVVYGTTDPKAGAAGSVLDLLAHPRLNHRPEVAGGLLAADCAALLTGFFGSRR